LPQSTIFYEDLYMFKKATELIALGKEYI